MKKEILQILVDNESTIEYGCFSKSLSFIQDGIRYCLVESEETKGFWNSFFMIYSKKYYCFAKKLKTNVMISYDLDKDEFNYVFDKFKKTQEDILKLNLIKQK